MNPGDTHPPDCPEFEYNNHPDRAVELPGRVADVLLRVRFGRLETRTAASDTRKVHGFLFDRLTPAGHSYFAGHYRGEEFRCLRRYEVRVGSHNGCPSRMTPGV